MQNYHISGEFTSAEIQFYQNLPLKVPFLPGKIVPLYWFDAIVAQLVEHWLPKPRVAGSSPVYRSK